MTFHPIEPDDFPWFDYSRYTFSLGLTHGSHAYLSGHTASEYDRDQRRMVAVGDMAAQARTAYAKIERILEAAGLGLDDVVRVTENVAVAGVEDYHEVEAVRAATFGDAVPAVNTVCVRNLLRPTALLEVEVVAGPAEAPMKFDAQGRPAWAPAREAADIVYLSSCLPLDQDGNLVGEGDMAAQAEQIFTNMQTRMKALGLDMSHVAKTVDFIARDGLKQYKDVGPVRKRFLSPPHPGATGILMPRIAAHPGVLLQVDVLASRHELEPINPGWDRYDKLTYLPAVKGGNVLFLSGQAALDPVTETAMHADDVVEQARYTYANLLKVLETAGAGPQHLIKTIEYVTRDGLKDYRGVAGVREEMLSAPWPASTGIICEGLLRPEFKFEVDALALLGDDE